MDKLRVVDLEIGKAYKGSNGNLYKISETHYNDELELLVKVKDSSEWRNSYLSANEFMGIKFTELSKEIDWSKLPRWIKVQVKDYPEEPWYNAYFIRLDDPLKDSPYKATFCDTFTLIENSICGYRQCRIHPEQEVKEEWYK